MTSYIYDTNTVMGYCMPDMATLKNDRPSDYLKWQLAFDEMLNSNPAGRQIQDLYLSSRAIYWSMAMSFVYCLIFIYFMSLFAEYIAWTMVILVQLGLFAATAFFMTEYMAMKNTTDINGNNVGGKYLAGGIVSGILAMVFLCAIWCGFNSLKTAIDVIDASADFLAKTKRIIAVPVLYFLVTVIFISIWLACMLCINSIGDIVPENTSLFVQNRNAKRTPEENKLCWMMFLYMFFGILWICAFIRAKTSFIAMVAATTYYFDSDENKEGDADVELGFKFAYMYHAGSLAFGSLIIAIIQFLRVVVMTLAEQAQRASGDNQAVKIIVGCANCCMKCIEKVCDYINKSAYAYMAVSGDSFCTSAWNGFLLNMKHGLKFAWANTLASMFIVLGKIGIVVLNMFSCYMIMKHITKDLGEISSPAAPLAIVGVVTYVSASIFLGLFDEAVLALMTCVAIDTDLNGHPKYGPPTFHDSLGHIEHGTKKNAIADGGWEKANKLDA